MPKLNDTQSILLSTASQRDSNSIYPLPDTLKAGAITAKAIKSLVDKSLAEERETTDAAVTYRTHGDISYGLFATDAGLAAIGIGDTPAPAAPPPKAERQNKTAAVIALLEREDGATLAELIEATDWLPHTTRAALTGLRKRGHAIERNKRGDQTCYRIVKAA